MASGTGPHGSSTLAGDSFLWRGVGQKTSFRVAALRPAIAGIAMTADLSLAVQLASEGRIDSYTLAALSAMASEVTDACKVELLVSKDPNLALEPTPVRLSDGTTGWRMQRFDDCLRAAIATVLQVAIDEVPDPHLNAKLRAGWQPSSVTQVTEITLTRWCEQRGLRMTRHDAPPWNRKRWIGVVPPPRRVTAGPFMSHCLVMCRREILHDPFALNSLVARYVAERFQKKTWLPSDVQYGFTFNKRKEAK